MGLGLGQWFSNWGALQGGRGRPGEELRSGKMFNEYDQIQLLSPFILVQPPIIGND